MILRQGALMAKRIILFLAVNFLVVMTISVLLNVFGVRPYLTQYGLNYTSLAIFCLIWGMAGSLISLALSRQMAKWTMGVQVLDPQSSGADEQRLIQTVHHLAQSAGLRDMPEVGVYDSPELNAFATGPTKSRSLVAVSTGLLRSMNYEEVEGVLGHEITHIANGDMVTMTLLQGVVNAFVMFLSRVIAYAIAVAMRSERDSRGLSTGIFYLVSFLLEIVFMILGSIVVAWFSRFREYRADQGGAMLAGRQKMIGALRALQRNYEVVDPKRNAAIETMQISGRGSGLMRLFASHPPLELRIQRLQEAA
ncbi:MAG TPA: protease HtpX [bacterium]|nr:protease HtpX [bacterium]